jgi:hypothetical protein
MSQLPERELDGTGRLFRGQVIASVDHDRRREVYRTVEGRRQDPCRRSEHRTEKRRMHSVLHFHRGSASKSLVRATVGSLIRDCAGIANDLCRIQARRAHSPTSMCWGSK